MNPADIVILALVLIGAFFAFRKFWHNSSQGQCSGCSSSSCCSSSHTEGSCPSAQKIVDSMSNDANSVK